MTITIDMIRKAKRDFEEKCGDPPYRSIEINPEDEVRIKELLVESGFIPKLFSIPVKLAGSSLYGMKISFNLSVPRGEIRVVSGCGTKSHLEVMAKQLSVILTGGSVICPACHEKLFPDLISVCRRGK